MSTRFRSTLISSAAVFAMFVSGMALAQRPDAQAMSEAPSVATAPLTVTALSPIKVIGRRTHIAAPVAIYMIKAALHTPINFRHENLNKLNCRMEAQPFPTLFCETNCQLLIFQSGGAFSNQLCASGERSAAYVGTPGWRKSCLPDGPIRIVSISPKCVR